jgi:hypothetical protein
MAGGVAEVVEYFREALSSNLNTTNKKKKCSFDMIGNMMRGEARYKTFKTSGTMKRLPTVLLLLF